MNSDDPSAVSCSSASYQYLVDLVNGVQLPSATFPAGTTPWSRVYNKAALSSAVQIIVLGNGTAKSVTHNSDATITENLIPHQTSSPIQKVAWREIFRD